MPSQTRIDEIQDGIYRVNTPHAALPGGFSFNQYLVLDDEPLVFHTGPRQLFPDVREAVARVLPPEQIRWVAFSHHEQDECGALGEWLAVAPQARAVCSQVAAVVGNAYAPDREPRPLADGG